MKVDIAIKNGTIVDPETNREQISDVYIKGGRIVEGSPATEAEHQFDASGLYVFPGLIDYHLHVFPDGTEIGVDADTSLLPQGVTTAVDAGSAGTANFSSFLDGVVYRNRMRVKAFLNLCPAGLITSRYHENVDPRYWDRDSIRRIVETNPQLVQGLKIRISKDIVHEMGLKPLEEAVKLAEEMEMRLAVHVTDPPGEMSDVAAALRRGDVLVHCFHGTGNTILDRQGKILQEIWNARKRGVVMDAANGRNHWAFSVAEAAIRQGFEPDVISTDLTSRTLYRDPVFGLPYLMSKYLMLGMSMKNIIAACTSKPASLLGMRGIIGTLEPGSVGDVAVFCLAEKAVDFCDTRGEIRRGNLVLIPRLTLLGGKVVFRSF